MSSPTPFYPPRAKGLGRLRIIRFWVARFLNNPFFNVPKTVGSQVLGYLVPWLGFSAAGRKEWVLGTMLAYMGALVVYIVRIGFIEATLALMVMMVIHVISVSVFYRKRAGDIDVDDRFNAGLLTLLSVVVFYIGMQFLLQRFILPVRFENRVLIVNRMYPTSQIKLGDSLVYNVPASYGQLSGQRGGYIIRGGYNFGKVLALPGDEVQFMTNTLCVNGIKFARNPNMPTTGVLTVATNCWFIWQDFVVSGHGQAYEVQAQEMLFRQGIVSQRECIGKVFDHWFFRKQL